MCWNYVMTCFCSVCDWPLCTFVEGTPQVSLESLPGSLLLSNGSGTVQSIASANRRKSKRLENKKVERYLSNTWNNLTVNIRGLLNLFIMFCMHLMMEPKLQWGCNIIGGKSCYNCTGIHNQWRQFIKKITLWFLGKKEFILGWAS